MLPIISPDTRNLRAAPARTPAGATQTPTRARATRLGGERLFEELKAPSLVARTASANAARPLILQRASRTLLTLRARSANPPAPRHHEIDQRYIGSLVCAFNNPNTIRGITYVLASAFSSAPTIRRCWLSVANQYLGMPYSCTCARQPSTCLHRSAGPLSGRPHVDIAVATEKIMDGSAARSESTRVVKRCPSCLDFTGDRLHSLFMSRSRC